MINILFIGDIVGNEGVDITNYLLPKIRKDYEIDCVVANGENVRNGKGISLNHAQHLRSIGVDVITSGNHIWQTKDVEQVFSKCPYLLRPLNYPPDNPGNGYYKGSLKNEIEIRVVNIQGRSFLPPIDCPFRSIESLLASWKKDKYICIIDIHAESTAEKQAIAWYLDGKVSAVIGTHTHVQTADERILPQGTGYITDVGMTGSFNSIIGMKIETAVQRFVYQRPAYYQIAKGDLRLNGLLVSVEENGYKTLKIKRINYSKLEYDGREIN
jgi:metallophosphoesterase (TIGR00282 family)